jgi:hypothetical protein
MHDNGIDGLFNLALEQMKGTTMQHLRDLHFFHKKARRDTGVVSNGTNQLQMCYTTAIYNGLAAGDIDLFLTGQPARLMDLTTRLDFVQCCVPIWNLGLDDSRRPRAEFPREFLRSALERAYHYSYYDTSPGIWKSQLKNAPVKFNKSCKMGKGVATWKIDLWKAVIRGQGLDYMCAPSGRRAIDRKAKEKRRAEWEAKQMKWREQIMAMTDRLKKARIRIGTTYEYPCLRADIRLVCDNLGLDPQAPIWPGEDM